MPPRKKPIRATFNPLRAIRQSEEAALAALAAKTKQKTQVGNSGGGVAGSGGVGASCKKATCPNKSCPSPNVVDGVCQTCGRVADDSNIVAEVQFGESPNGAAVVQGQFVGEDQGGISSAHPAFRRLGGGADTRERSIRDARHELERMAQQLHIPDRIVQRAVQIFKLALGHRFTQGRRLPTVYAVCLYLACRSHKDGGENEDGEDNREAFENVVTRKPAQNQVMLIDFADVIHVNVFSLGRAFKALHAVVPATENGWLPINPEDLIFRFASRLEFLHETEQVALTAVRLVKRMSLDMMAEGRRPSGICGACLLMAARIHNFRRSIREVVYVVKVTMETIRLRMDEFRSTEASGMSVEDFLSDNWTAVSHAKPPSFYGSEYARALRSRKRKRSLISPGATNEDHDETAESETCQDADPKNVQLIQELASLPFVEYHRDSKGRIIIPQEAHEDSIDGTSPAVVCNLVEEFGDQRELEKTKRTRAEKSLPIDQTWRGDEQEIEQEITEMINDPATIQHAKAFETAMQRAKVHNEIAVRDLKDVSMEPTVAEKEFDDDPEVQNCLLSEEEVRLKEILWTNENEQFLRKEQAKIFHDKITSKLSKPRNPRKRRRTGEPPGQPAATAGDSAMNVAHRLHFSSRLDYEIMEAMFSGEHAAGPRSCTRSLASKRTSREGSASSVATLQESSSQPP